jgi:tocopherol O-methyltransferase
LETSQHPNIMASMSPDLKNAVREHYDEMAPIYRQFWGDHIHHGLFLAGNESPECAQTKLLDHCSRLASVFRGSRVLDAGCGHGGTALYLAKKFGCHVTGITLSHSQAELARAAAIKQRQVRKLDFIVADLEAWDFPLSAFDLVWVMESSEHLTDRETFFRNVARTLKPGGVLMLAAWTGARRDPVVAKVADIFLCSPLQESADYCEQIERAGMTVQCQQDLSANVWQTWLICQQRMRRFSFLLPTLPREARNFAGGIDVILEAYRCGALHYSVICARRDSLSGS